MKPGWIARQSRQPTGWVGEGVARVMAWDTRKANRSVLERLALPPGGSALEIGCGHGRSLACLARRFDAGFVAGIDPSDVMVRIATRHLRRDIEAGRAEVHRGEAAKLPFADERFDIALAVHVLYFWPDPREELREIHRVLRPGGTLVLGFRPDSAQARAALPACVYHLQSLVAVEAALRDSGFGTLEVDEISASFVCLCASRDAREA